MTALDNSAIGIPIRGEKIVLVDCCDVALVLAHPWRASKDGNTHYVKCQIYHGYADWRFTRLHRLILGAQKGQLVDHINGDGLDNRRSNLRLATHGQNVAHQVHFRAGVTGFRGVYLEPTTGRFRARLCQGGRRHDLGSYRSAEAAARAYDDACVRMNGEFAVLNFPVSA